MDKFVLSKTNQKNSQLVKEFVFVPADKASVRRKFYIVVLPKESTNSPTFQLTQVSETEICTQLNLVATYIVTLYEKHKIKCKFKLCIVFRICTQHLSNIDFFFAFKPLFHY